MFDILLLLLLLLLLHSSSSSSSSCGLAVCAGWVVPLVSPLRLLPSLHPRLLVTFNFEKIQNGAHSHGPRLSASPVINQSPGHRIICLGPCRFVASPVPVLPVLRVLLLFFSSSAIASAGPGKNRPSPNSTWPGTEPAVCVLRVLCGCAGDLKIGCHYRPNLQR